MSEIVSNIIGIAIIIFCVYVLPVILVRLPIETLYAEISKIEYARYRTMILADSFREYLYHKAYIPFYNWFVLCILIIRYDAFCDSFVESLTSVAAEKLRQTEKGGDKQ